MQRILEIYDIEVLANCFTYTGYVPSENKYYQYVIWKDRNDVKKLCKHLLRGIYMVGFNNEGYDYPIIHHILNHYNEYVNSFPGAIMPILYKKSQEVIDMEFSAIADKNKFIPQLDLYKIWHFNNPARACSLKALECAMRMDNIEEMPFEHTHYVQNEDELNLILDYNKWDVYCTHQFYLLTTGETEHPLYKGKNKLKLRKDILKKYKIPCLNFPDVKIGEELLLHLYSLETNSNKYELRKMGTPRSEIDLGKCVFDYIKFQTKPFQELLNWFKHQKITSTKGAFSDLPLKRVTDLLPYMYVSNLEKKKGIVSNINLKVQDLVIDYGTGGLHASLCGVFCADENYVILDVDVGSLYPSIAVQNNLYPQHLGPIFSKIYNDNIVSVRLTEKAKPKKERDPVIMEGLKLAANGSYGKSNEESSFLYDPEYTMKTTINGQLSLSMLIEDILLHTDSTLLQANTDGITLRIRKSDLEQVLNICKNWEKVTKLVLEYAYYSKMVIRDVSNYLAVYTNGEIKHKGAFEIDKEIYKNPSMRIVPIALEKFFVEGIPIEDTIRGCKDIYDFCLMTRVKKGWQLEYSIWDKETGAPKVIECPKTQRYYASNKGVYLMKRNVGEGKGSDSSALAGQAVTLFNKFEKKSLKEYDIDYQFYINECNKIIDKICPITNLSLF